MWDSHVVSHMIAVTLRVTSARPETESRMQRVCVCVRLGRGWNRRAESAEPVAATVGQRAGGVSLPRGDIISCVLSTGRRCRHKGRGRAKDRGGGCRHRRGRVGFKAGVRGLPTPTLPHHQRSLRSRVGRTIRSMRSNLVHSHKLLFLFPIEKSCQTMDLQQQIRENVADFWLFPKLYLRLLMRLNIQTQRLQVLFFIAVKVLTNKRGNFSSLRRDTDVGLSGAWSEHQNESFSILVFVRRSHVGFLRLALKSASD